VKKSGRTSEWQTKPSALRCCSSTCNGVAQAVSPASRFFHTFYGRGSACRRDHQQPVFRLSLSI
jgi:hypothetical protein